MAGELIRALFSRREQVHQDCAEALFAQMCRDELVAHAVAAAAAAVHEDHDANSARRNQDIAVDIYAGRVEADGIFVCSQPYTPVGNVSGTSGSVHRAVTSSGRTALV